MTQQTPSEVQASNNRTTRNSWNWYGPHRAMVMKLVEQVHRSREDRIAVLGAGNCNDLDLRWLAHNFRTIDLVDLDPAALSYGLRFQAAANGNICCRAPVDITGQFHNFPLSPGDDQSLVDYQGLLNHVQQAALPLMISEPCEVMVSCCVFTPIVETLSQLTWPADKLTDLVLLFRRRHFELLLGSITKGGRVIFISDCVSSKTFAGLADLPAEEAGPALQQCVETRNFFTGLNPYAIVEMLKEPLFSSVIREVYFVVPWIWKLSEQHARLTYAFLLDT